MEDLTRDMSDQPPKGKSWFFGIGINIYEDPEIPNLNNAVKDVKDMMYLLLARYDIDETISLFDHKAKRGDILKQLEDFAKPGAIGEEDKLLIYFSGHGNLQTNDGYWVAHDSETNYNRRKILIDVLKKHLEKINCKHILVISDSCHAGALFGQQKKALTRSTESQLSDDLPERGLGEKVYKELEHAKSRWAFCSGQYDQKVMDGRLGENSPFASSIIEVLKQNKKKKLSIDEVSRVVRSKVLEKNIQRPQYGRLFSEYTGEYIFNLIPSGEEKLWHYCDNEGTLVAYNSFLNYFPKSEYADDAIKEIEKFEEENEEEKWDAVRKIDKISAYQKFLRNNKDERLKKMANERINILLANPDLRKKQFEESFMSQSNSHAKEGQNNPVVGEADHGISGKKRGKKIAIWAIGILLLFAAIIIGDLIDITETSGQELVQISSFPVFLPDSTELVAPPDGQPNEPNIEQPGDEDEPPLPPVDHNRPKPQPQFLKFGSKQYKVISLANRTWLSQNLDTLVTGSWCYDTTSNCQKYGRLYTWEAAVNVCKSIGGGWRLPTDEDWKALALATGGYYDEDSKYEEQDSKLAAKILLYETDGFEAVKGGFRFANGEFKALGARGVYWTSTTTLHNKGEAYVFDFLQDGEMDLWRRKVPKSQACSCRCVKD